VPGRGDRRDHQANSKDLTIKINLPHNKQVGESQFQASHRVPSSTSTARHVRSEFNSNTKTVQVRIGVEQFYMLPQEDFPLTHTREAPGSFKIFATSNTLSTFGSINTSTTTSNRSSTTTLTLATSACHPVSLALLHLRCASGRIVSLLDLLTALALLRLRRASGRMVSLLDMLSGHTGSTSPTSCVRSQGLTAWHLVRSHWLYFTYVVCLVAWSRCSTHCPTASVLPQLRCAPRLLTFWLHRLYFAHVMCLVADLATRLVVSSHWLYSSYVVHPVASTRRSTCCPVPLALLCPHRASGLMVSLFDSLSGRIDSTSTMPCPRLLIL
jgi:hypothetical protein